MANYLSYSDKELHTWIDEAQEVISGLLTDGVTTTEDVDLMANTLAYSVQVMAELQHRGYCEDVDLEAHVQNWIQRLS